jgi:putative aldouronate transport system substrate-binding protein
MWRNEMKKSFVKKALLMAAASVFLAGSLYAGGKQQSGTSGSSSAGGATPSLTVACLEGWYSAVSMNDNLPVWQEMEKRTGVHINWQANADYDTAMNPVIASGRNLPDIMLIPPTWTNAGVTNLAIDGTIIPLDDLIARHAPNIQKVFNANPDIKALMTCPDGKIYSIADVIKDVNNMVLPGQLYIRKD